MIAFDVETHLIPTAKVNKRNITVDTLTPRLVCVSISLNGAAPELLSREDGIKSIASALREEEEFVGHNVAYDFAVLMNEDPSLAPLIWNAYRAGRVRDTEVTERLINIALGEHVYREVPDDTDPDQTKNERVTYGLAALSKRYLGLELDKADDGPRLEYGALEGIPLSEWPDRAVAYAKMDAEATYGVYAAQTARLDGLVTEEEVLRRTRYAWALHLMSCRGMVASKEHVRALKDELMAKRVAAREELIKHGIYQFKGKKVPKISKSVKAVQERVAVAYRLRGKPVPMTEPVKGRQSKVAHVPRIAVDNDTLINSGDSVLKTLADIGPTDKALDTYIPILEVAGEHSIHPRFKVLVNSGRTACASPNMQNLPRELGIRECWGARPGFYLLSVDYSTLELCTLAQANLWLFGESAMADAINAGRDLHLEFAARLLGITYDEALRRKGEAAVKKARQFGKVFNFGKPGGLQAKRMIEYAKNNYGLDMTYEESCKYSDMWLKAFPEMRKYFNHVKKKCPDYGDKATFTQFVSGRRRGGTGYTDGCNTYFQGLAADGALAALERVVYECYNGALTGCHAVGFIHDEIILEVPVGRQTQAGLELKRLMIEEMKRWVPDVDIRTDDPACMKRWFKDAAAVWMNSELQPWEPEEKSNDKRAA